MSERVFWVTVTETTPKVADSGNEKDGGAVYGYAHQILNAQGDPETLVRMVALALGVGVQSEPPK